MRQIVWESRDHARAAAGAVWALLSGDELPNRDVLAAARVAAPGAGNHVFGYVLVDLERMGLVRRFKRPHPIGRTWQLTERGFEESVAILEDAGFEAPLR